MRLQEAQQDIVILHETKVRMAIHDKDKTLWKEWWSFKPWDPLYLFSGA